MRKIIGLAALLALATAAGVASAEPPSGVDVTSQVRGTYEAFSVKSKVHEADYDFDFQAKASTAIDLVVREHAYAAGGSTGWHTHPGPVFITVTTGTLTIYEVDDPSCTPIHVSAGQGYVDTGLGHVARNETSVPATDVTVISAPVGKPFRTHLPVNANPACPF